MVAQLEQLLITVGCQLAWDGIRRVYVSAASARFCLHRSPDVATQLRQPATDLESSVSSGDVPWEKRKHSQWYNSHHLLRRHLYAAEHFNVQRKRGGPWSDL